jgi:uncharacterized protein (TIGR03546 family)
MFWLKLVKDLIAIFREGQTPRQVAGGFALGSIVGLSPMLTLQGLVVWLVILVLDVNLAAALMALTLCSLCAYLFDPIFHWLGYQILVNIEGLRSIWTALYNAPIAPLTRFNNTVVMGSLVVALVLALPIYFGSKHLVIAYRKTIGARVEKSKVYQILKHSTLVQWYTKIRDLGA